MRQLIEAKGIVKSYGTTRVLQDVAFDLQAGEVHALLGGNGAGKSTLMRILAGLVAPSAGEVRIAGEKLDIASPAEAQRVGLYLVPQEAQLFPNQDVLENICLGLPKPAAHYRAKVEQFVAQFGLHLDLQKRASTLEIAERQLVEILRGMIRDARVLILDEPTSSLTPFEVAALFGRMRALRAAGVGLVFISHKLHELRQIADRITVLRDGKSVLSGPMAALSDEQILQAMSPGLAALGEAPAGAQEGAPEVLAVERLSGEGFCDISFGLRRGEILGLAGVVGAGRTELAETLVGLRPRSGGSLVLNGQRIEAKHWHLRQAVDQGLVLLSEDRGGNGLFLEAPLHWNLTSFLTHRLPFILRNRADRAQFDLYRRSLSIRCEGANQPAGRLSGGNQQKLLLAKCLISDPAVLILDEPTRGVDAGARADIYELIRQIAAKGAAVLMISSDFDEITRLSHRILVMAGGRIAGALPAGADAEQIGSLAFEAREALDV